MAQDHDNSRKLAELYRETIKRHAANPVGYRHAVDATHRHEEYNPLCGDRIEIMLRVEDGRVEDAAFDGEACAICLASASLLCSLGPGLNVSELTSLGSELHAALRNESDLGGGESRMNPLPRELQPLLGVRPYPSRVRCATLPWETAARALADPGAGAGGGETALFS